MASIILPGRWQTQPSGLVEVDRSHWAGEFLALPSGFAGGAGVLGFGGSPALAAEPTIFQGRQLIRNASGAGITGPSIQSAKQSGLNTFIVQQRANATYATHATAAALHFGYQDASNYRAYLQHSQGGGVVQMKWNMPDGLAFTGAKLYTYGTLIAAALVNNNGVNVGYEDGLLAAGSANARTPGTVSGLLSLLLGNKFDLGYALHFAGLAMSAAQVLDMYRNPWQVFKPRKQVLYFDAGGGVSQALEGAAAAQATATAELTHSIPLAAAGLSIATADGAMSVSIPLAGSALAQADAAGDLTTLGVINLAGNATATANASGGLSVSIPLSASAVAQALAQAGITHDVPLSGAAAAAASAAAAITLNASLSGIALSQAAASAGLTTSGAVTTDLAGSAAAQASAAGALSHAVPLTGAAVTVSGAAGSLTQIVPVAGAAASASSATGGLDVTVRLDGDALSSALAAGGITHVPSTMLAGNALADASAQGAVTLRVNLDGAALAAAIASGALSVDGLLSGIASAQVVRVTSRVTTALRCSSVIMSHVSDVSAVCRLVSLLSVVELEDV